MPSFNPSESLVVLDNVKFAYGIRTIHQDLSLSIPRGSVVSIMGPSGCGKSTLLNFIGGRIKPNGGTVTVDGDSVHNASRKQLFTLRKKMGMLFQHNALLTDLSVFENIAFPLREHTNLTESMIRDVVIMKLQMVGLRGARHLMPEECSGGMQRRVALARAIALDPMLIMYDEPFTGLDPISKGVIKTLIRELNDALGLTSIVVTHDMAEGCEISDYIAVLGGGKVLGFGTPDELLNSDVPDIVQFMSGNPHGPVPYHYPADDLSTELAQSRDL